MTTATAKRPARWARRSDAARRTGLSRALELFVERGYSAAPRRRRAARRRQQGHDLPVLRLKEELMRAAIRLAIQPRLQYAEEALQKLGPQHARGLTADRFNWWQDDNRSSARGILKLLVSEYRNFPSWATSTARKSCIAAAASGCSCRSARHRPRRTARHRSCNLPADEAIAPLASPVDLAALARHVRAAAAGREELPQEPISM